MPVLDVGRPVGHPNWDQALGQRVSILARDGIQVAELKLQPPELGAVDVRIRVRDGEAVVHFTAQSAAAREAIDLALPRLREMLAESGLTLTESEVSDQKERNASESPEPDEGLARTEVGDGQGSEAQDASTPIADTRPGLLDHYV